MHCKSRAVLTFAEQSSEPLMTRGGPLRRGQQLLTKASCSAIFLVCCPVSASQALSDLSGEADTSFSPICAPVQLQHCVFVACAAWLVACLSVRACRMLHLSSKRV